MEFPAPANSLELLNFHNNYFRLSFAVWTHVDACRRMEELADAPGARPIRAQYAVTTSPLFTRKVCTLADRLSSCTKTLRPIGIIYELQRQE